VNSAPYGQNSWHFGLFWSSAFLSNGPQWLQIEMEKKKSLGSNTGFVMIYVQGRPYAISRPDQNK